MNNVLSLRGRFPGKEIWDNIINGNAGRHYPHWELSDAIYHICFRLRDSVPRKCIKEWIGERNLLMAQMQLKKELDSMDIWRLQYYFSSKIESYIDRGYGSCIFQDFESAKIMAETLQNKNGILYDLYAWCIMPNHIHVLASLCQGNTLTKMVGAWKSVSAHLLNRRRHTMGRLWNEDYYNRIIRTGDDYARIKEYIWKNPDVAGLSDWPWRWMAQNEER